MSTKKMILAVLLMSSIVPVNAQDTRQYSDKNEIKGGILYWTVNGPVFYDLETGSEKSINIRAKKIPSCPPFDAPRNGEHLAYFQDSKFYTVVLPDGNPQAVSCQIMKEKGNVKKYHAGKIGARVNIVPGEMTDLIWKGQVRNLRLSPEGSRLAFGAPYFGEGLVLANQGNPKVLAKFATAGMLSSTSALRNPLIFRALPLFVKGIDSCDGIFIPSTYYNEHYPPLADIYKPVCGNIIERTATLPLYRTNGLGSGNGPTIIEGMLKGGDRDGIKRNAYFFTFQNSEQWNEGKRLALFIFRSGNHWGPFKIVSIDYKMVSVTYKLAERSYIGHASFNETSFNETSSNHRKEATAIEIPASLPSCEGLAWLPNGCSFSFLSMGNVYVVSLDSATNNGVFKTTPKLVAQKIFGDCLYWISNSTFIFRNKNMEVCLCQKGNIKKLLASVPSNFCYLEKSPFESPAALGHGKMTINSRAFYLKNYSDVNIGYIKTAVVSGPGFCVAKTGNQEALEYCVVDEPNLERLACPSKYRFLKPTKGKVYEFPGNKTLLLRNGDKCSAIKVIETYVVPLSTGKPIKLTDLSPGSSTEGYYRVDIEWRALEIEEFPSKNSELALSDNNLKMWEWTGDETSLTHMEEPIAKPILGDKNIANQRMVYEPENALPKSRDN
jgi:hypothetical protein